MRKLQSTKNRVGSLNRETDRVIHLSNRLWENAIEIYFKLFGLFNHQHEFLIFNALKI